MPTGSPPGGICGRLTRPDMSQKYYTPLEKGDMAASISAKRVSLEPTADMNMTPLINVLLVLLIMFIITIPIAAHSVDVDLPTPCADCPDVPFDSVKNRLMITADDRLRWNGNAIEERQLPSLLRQTLALPVEPELQFAPEATASYNMASRTVATINARGVTQFGFVGHDRFADF